MGSDESVLTRFSVENDRARGEPVNLPNQDSVIPNDGLERRGLAATPFLEVRVPGRVVWEDSLLRVRRVGCLHEVDVHRVVVAFDDESALGDGRSTR